MIGEGLSARLSDLLGELQHAESQFRIVTVLLACSMLFDLLDPAIFIMSVHSSLTYRIASLTHHPEIVALAYVTVATLLLPYLLMQAFCPRCPGRRLVTKMACFTLACGAVLWFFMAWMARDLDIGPVVGVFIRTGLGAIGFSFCLAFSLNAEQVRLLLERT